MQSTVCTKTNWKTSINRRKSFKSMYASNARALAGEGKSFFLLCTAEKSHPLFFRAREGEAAAPAFVARKKFVCKLENIFVCNHENKRKGKSS